MTDYVMQCDDDQLVAVLDMDEIRPEHDSLLEHVESCSHCQSRLQELAATENDWQKAASILTSTDDAKDAAEDRTRLTRESQQWSHRTSRSIAWKDSVVRQFLDPPSHPEMLGRLGRYEIERLIGSGGMGIVFKAFDTELNRPVAIKILAPFLADSESARQRFAREARAAAGVVDDHVVPIHNVESENEPPYLVMQYIAGGSLQEKLDREGPFDVAEVLRIGLQTARGLAAAHAQGLIHRDVKPSNILLDEGIERALLTDFGLARTEDDVFVTRTGHNPGTPHYMSPEQIKGEPLDPRSDLFSLGCVLYSLCTGGPPFRADSTYAVLRCVTDENPPFVREINPNIPAWLEDIVMRLLEKSREDRFQTAEEVAELLEQCLAHVQQPATTPMPVVKATSTTGRDDWPPFRKAIASAAFGFGLLFAGILIVLELNKGTLRIESEVGDVPIRIMQGDEVVDRMTVTQLGQSIRIAAGSYTVVIDGKMENITVRNNSVTLHRRDTETIRIVQTTDVAGAEEASGKSGPRTLSLDELIDFTSDAREALAAGVEGKITVDIYGGEDVLGQMNTSGANKARQTQLFLDLQKINGVTINFRSVPVTPKNKIIGAVVRDPARICAEEFEDTGKPSTTAHAIAAAFAKADIEFRWDSQPKASVSSTVVQDAVGALEQSSETSVRMLKTYRVRSLLDEVDRDKQFERLIKRLQAKWGPHVTGDSENYKILVSQSVSAHEDISKLLDSLKPLESGDRQKSIANLSRIVTALHRYHADHHHLPAAAINGKDGKGGPPHSWRVELLPYLDEQPLYDSYHFDEPWDSDHNKQLAETMPDVFRCPLDKPDSINTSYFGITSQDKPAGYGDSGESDSDFGGGYEAPQSTASFESSGGLGSGESETDSGGGGLGFGLGVGDDNQTAQVAPVRGTTVFWNHTGCRFRNVTDGTSYTIAVVEAKRSVPWTQPTDIEYSRDKPLPEFGGWWKQGWFAGFVDGSVKFLAAYSDKHITRHLITIGDGVHVEPQEAGRLEVRESTDQKPDSEQLLQFEDISSESVQYIQFNAPPVLTEADIRSVSISPNDTHSENDSPFVSIEITLTEQAGRKFLAKTTELGNESPPGYLPIIFDGDLVFAPRVRSPISNKLVITGLRDRELAQRIITYLQRTIYLYRNVTSANTSVPDAETSAPNVQLDNPPRPRFTTPELLMDYFADCQYRNDGVGAINCYSDDVINSFATSYLLTASIMISSEKSDSGLEYDNAATGRTKALIDKSLVTDLSGIEAAALAQATELFKDGSLNYTKEELKPYELALMASTPSILKDPRQFVTDFVRLNLDEEGKDSSANTPKDRPVFSIERSKGKVWAVNATRGNRFELEKFGDYWLISDPWPDEKQEANASETMAVGANDSQLIHKSNVRNLRRAEGNHPDLESIISVDISGDTGIDWQFNADPLQREPLGFQFNVDNVSRGSSSVIPLIDQQGNTIRTATKMLCADATDEFWKRISGVKVGFHISQADFDHVLSGQTITRIVYLPNKDASVSPEEVVTLDSRIIASEKDVFEEAARLGQPVISVVLNSYEDPGLQKRIESIKNSLVTFSFTGSNDNATISSFGAGWIVDENGLIIAPSHALPSSVHETIEVRTAGGRQSSATRVGNSGHFTLLMAEAAVGISPISLDDISTPRTGETVLGLLNTTDVGAGKCIKPSATVVISEIGEVTVSPPLRFYDCIQTDLSPDESTHTGAPLLTSQGQVAGMCINIAEQFLIALPSNEVKVAVDTILKDSASKVVEEIEHLSQNGKHIEWLRHVRDEEVQRFAGIVLVGYSQRKLQLRMLGDAAELVADSDDEIRDALELVAQVDPLFKTTPSEDALNAYNLIEAISVAHMAQAIDGPKESLAEFQSQVRGIHSFSALLRKASGVLNDPRELVAMACEHSKTFARNTDNNLDEPSNWNITMNRHQAVAVIQSDAPAEAIHIELELQPDAQWQVTKLVNDKDFYALMMILSGGETQDASAKVSTTAESATRPISSN